MVHVPTDIPLLDSDLLRTIGEIGRSRVPREACGVIVRVADPLTGQQVFEVPNRAMTPDVEYEMRGADVWLALEHYMDRVPSTTIDDIIPWHTHPGGSTSPSRADMHHRRPEFPHQLIVALRGSEALATWF